MGGRKGERDGKMEGEIERRRNERDGERYMGTGEKGKDEGMERVIEG